MPITGSGWELLITRQTTQRHPTQGRVRTVGTYQVHHDGAPVQGLSGTTAESPGPGDNSKAENKKRVEAGRYPLWTQNGAKYDTVGYKQNESTGAITKPGLALADTNKRIGILIHPGNGFLSSVGCINLCTRLPTPGEPISYPGSRKRVIALIEDLQSYFGVQFTTRMERIPKAWVVIDGEP